MSSLNRRMMALLQIILVIVMIGLTFTVGYWVRGQEIVTRAQPDVTPTAAAAPDRSALLAEVQGLLDKYYVKPLPADAELTYGAIRGMIGTLQDRFTIFIPPPVAASESNVFAGRYGGIGVQVKRDAAGNFSLYPFRDAPAAQAGIRDGDILRRAGDRAVDSALTQDVVVQLLRGEVKTENNIANGVTIVIERAPSAERLTFTIPFAEIQVPSVVWRVLQEETRVGYIQILNFTARTPEELKQAIAELRTANIQAAIVDLRDNPGGLLTESVTVAGELMSKGVILYEVSKEGEKTYQTEADGTLIDLPLWVLINKGTASAAELVAGALHDRERAVLIGENTYGKGSIQYVFPLADKSSVHVTVAEWFPPKRAKLDTVGIAPDMVIPADPNGVDVQLNQAVAEARTKLG